MSSTIKRRFEYGSEDLPRLHPPQQNASAICGRHERHDQVPLRAQEQSDPGFTVRYHVNRVVHIETTEDAAAAIAREKQIKGRLRKEKVALIEAENPQWLDLSERWFEAQDRDPSLRSGLTPALSDQPLTSRPC